MTALVTLLLCTVHLILAKPQPHSEYASRIDPIKKYLPRSLFLNPNPQLHENEDVNDLECKVRQLALKYAEQIQPFRNQSATSDALNINHYCTTQQHTPPQPQNPQQTPAPPIHFYNSNSKISNPDSPFTIYVDPTHGRDTPTTLGTFKQPFQSIHSALSKLRAFKSNAAIKQIIIREGTLYLNSTITLSPSTFDNNLLIRSYPFESATISGGVPLSVSSLKWSRYQSPTSSPHNIWQTTLNESITQQLFNATILSLFTQTPHTRLTRARYPNGHVEVWNNGAYYLNPYYVNQWFLTPNGTVHKPQQVFKNLTSFCSNNNNNTSQAYLCLNHSKNRNFDTYTAGFGNFCDLWTPSYSYWCGAHVSGGWAEQDQRMALQGVRQLPTGMRFNTSLLPELAAMNASSLSDGIVYIHHSQGWNSFWWDISDANNVSDGLIMFGKGGFQGGRVWTKTHDLNRDATTNLPIMGGSWYVDNVFGALDEPGEWFFDKESKVLYYWPNQTEANGLSPAQVGVDLVIGNLQTLFSVRSWSADDPVFNVTFGDMVFRDTRYTFMDEWGTPSGGDWALYNGGAVYFENSSSCAVVGCEFVRLDGNCVAMFGWNRYSKFVRNEFAWIGDNVIGAWGKTDDWDGTGGHQPRFTYVVENYVHDIGLYQLQSSLLFMAKSCLSVVERNIVFNIPRAAILFNDAFGGGSNVTNNLIFNTCTQSGDHGPINSWNRMPFLTTLAHGTPSFDSLYNNIVSNFVFANYGGSQSFDTDDGSAWHNIESNFFYDAQAYKNDYGGFNVKYVDNINVALSGNTHNSWGIGAVNPDGPGNTIYGNKIVVFYCRDPAVCDTNGQIWSTGNLGGKGVLQLHDNDYYTPHGNASILTDKARNLTEMFDKYGLCKGSTANPLPSVDTIVGWAAALLNITV